MKCTLFGKYLYLSCVFLALSIKISYIWSVQFINFKSYARHGLGKFLSINLFIFNGLVVSLTKYNSYKTIQNVL